jgi:choline kinase
MAIRAVMLAAGIGRRLSGDAGTKTPKALLRFGAKTLLARHVENLRGHGVRELVLVVGHRAEDIEAELQSIGAAGFARTLVNPDYRRGSMLSLWAAREELESGDDILFMDADVLYHPHLIRCLVEAPHGDCFTIDRDFDQGDEPVKLCLKGGAIVEFRKKVDVAHDTIGEWPGFLRLSPRSAGELVAAMRRYVDTNRLDEPYEEAMRDVALADPRRFHIEDVTGYPWIEIDFPSDVLRAERDVLPKIKAAERAENSAAIGRRPASHPSTGSG